MCYVRTVFKENKKSIDWNIVDKFVYTKGIEEFSKGEYFNEDIVSSNVDNIVW